MQRLFRQAKNLLAAHLVTFSRIRLAVHQNLPQRRLSLPRNHFDEFSLTIPGDAGNSNYFMRFDDKRE